MERFKIGRRGSAINMSKADRIRYAQDILQKEMLPTSVAIRSRTITNFLHPFRSIQVHHYRTQHLVTLHAAHVVECSKQVDKWPSLSSNGHPVAATCLRQYEQTFDEVVYFLGVPWFPWSWLEPKLTTTSRGKPQAILRHFYGECLWFHDDGTRELMTTSGGCNDVVDDEQVYLRLPRDDRCKNFAFLLNAWTTWEIEQLPDATSAVGPQMEYIEWKGPFVKGVFYGWPPEDTPASTLSTVALRSTSTAVCTTDRFSLPKVVKAPTSAKDNTNTNLLQARLDIAAHGEVRPLFGVEVEPHHLNLAETMLKAVFTKLGFGFVCVKPTRSRHLELFKFNKSSISLLHQVVCWLRYIFPLPATRVTTDHPGSITNPMPENGGTIVRTPPPTADATPTWPHQAAVPQSVISPPHPPSNSALHPPSNSALHSPSNSLLHPVAGFLLDTTGWSVQEAIPPSISPVHPLDGFVNDVTGWSVQDAIPPRNQKRTRTDSP